MEEEKKIKIIKLLTIIAVFFVILAFYFSYKANSLKTANYNKYDYLGITMFGMGFLSIIPAFKLMNSIENVKEKLDQRPPKKEKKQKNK